MAVLSDAEITKSIDLAVMLPPYVWASITKDRNNLIGTVSNLNVLRLQDILDNLRIGWNKTARYRPNGYNPIKSDYIEELYPEELIENAPLMYVTNKWYEYPDEDAKVLTTMLFADGKLVQYIKLEDAMRDADFEKIKRVEINLDQKITKDNVKLFTPTAILLTNGILYTNYLYYTPDKLTIAKSGKFSRILQGIAAYDSDVMKIGVIELIARRNRRPGLIVTKFGDKYKVRRYPHEVADVNGEIVDGSGINFKHAAILPIYYSDEFPRKIVLDMILITTNDEIYMSKFYEAERNSLNFYTAVIANPRVSPLAKRRIRIIVNADESADITETGDFIITDDEITSPIIDIKTARSSFTILCEDGTVYTWKRTDNEFSIGAGRPRDINDIVDFYEQGLLQPNDIWLYRIPQRFFDSKVIRLADTNAVTTENLSLYNWGFIKYHRISGIIGGIFWRPDRTGQITGEGYLPAHGRYLQEVSVETLTNEMI